MRSLFLFLDDDALGRHPDRALGEHDVALEHGFLGQIVGAHAVGFDLQGLVGVGLFRQHGERCERRQDGDQDADEAPETWRPGRFHPRLRSRGASKPRTRSRK